MELTKVSVIAVLHVVALMVVGVNSSLAADSSRLTNSSISFDIATTWDSKPVDHRPVRISIGREQNGSLPITITGPLFNSPPGPSAPKGNVPGLWNYEGRPMVSEFVTMEFLDSNTKSIAGYYYCQCPNF